MCLRKLNSLNLWKTPDNGHRSPQLSITTGGGKVLLIPQIDTTYMKRSELLSANHHIFAVENLWKTMIFCGKPVEN